MFYVRPGICGKLIRHCRETETSPTGSAGIPAGLPVIREPQDSNKRDLGRLATAKVPSGRSFRDTNRPFRAEYAHSE